MGLEILLVSTWKDANRKKSLRDSWRSFYMHKKKQIFDVATQKSDWSLGQPPYSRLAYDHYVKGMFQIWLVVATEGSLQLRNII